MSATFKGSQAKLHVEDDTTRQRVTTKEKVLAIGIFATLLATIIILGFILYNTKQELKTAKKDGMVYIS